jgi:phosphatidylethanolamine/phosphatidyl-N-methylethanolamine N-methyltransferase
MGDRLLFLKLWWRAPLKIAAWSPSGATLSRAIARHVDPRSPLPVLELGGGTGTVTRALIDIGVRPELLYVIEREPELCALLRARFPGVTILEGDAAALGEMLRARGVRRLSAVVSTLPIIWFSPAQQQRIADQAFALLGRGSFLQMTNQPRSPLAHRALGLRGRIVNFVWRNLPPSFVWRYERERVA